MAQDTAYQTTTQASGETPERAEKEKMPFFDARLYKTLLLYDNGKKENDYYGNSFYPHIDYGSYISDFYGTIGDIDQKINDAEDPAEIAQLQKIKEGREDFFKEWQDSYFAQRSFVHPYALVKLAGTTGRKSTAEAGFTYDSFNKRKWYEIDGEQVYSGNYSKTPTTTALISWGSDPDKKGKTPYCFQDFVFCKWWNRIENNRMITLRRYAAPVTDNIEFKDYDVQSEGDGVMKGMPSNNPWTP